MDTWYWILEYGKVFLAYLFLMFLWPSVVFRAYLHEKTKTYRFCFCVTVPIVIINTVVLGLGLFHGLNQWVIRLIFYGLFILALLKNIATYFYREYKSMLAAKEIPDIRIAKGKYRLLLIAGFLFRACCKCVGGVKNRKQVGPYSWLKIRIWIQEAIWALVQRFSAAFWKYGILALVLVYGMVYFSYGAFQVYSYGYGDLYVHHEWIYGLIQGNIFPSGVYPEAMHCFIYCIHTLFGVRVYSVLLFLQEIHVGVFLLSAYLLMRKIFHWRYTPVFVLMLFLTVNLCNADLIHSMFRMQITLPQEFGLHMVFLCALHLINYLYRDCACAADEKENKCFWDENLLLFLLSLAAVVMIHFHVALMALIFCVSVTVFALKRVFSRKYFIPLAVSALCACLIAVLPMSVALAQGIPFNSSIDWAVGAMNGEESRLIRGQDEKATAENENDLGRNSDDISVTARIVGGILAIYEEGYGALYGHKGGTWILLVTIIMSAFCWFTRQKVSFTQYPFALVVSVIYIFVYIAPIVGVPDILPEGRFFGPGHMMLLSVMMMPVDMLFSYLMHISKEMILRIASLVSLVGIYFAAIITGNFRGFLFYELSRYNAAVMVTESIINTFPRYSYTIISPTDELYPVIQYGWHEELLLFVENCSQIEYYIPSEYVFIYVEKKPLLYAQSHFFQGSSWMGEEKYLEPFWEIYSAKYPDSGASQSPEIIATHVSGEEADKGLPDYDNAWSIYLEHDKRTILQSKAYDWCQKFSEKYPSVLDVYYEDDDFICYYFRQSAGSLPYDLGMGEVE